MAEPVTTTLRRALRLISEERPDATAGMARCLEGLSLSITIGAEPEFALCASQGKITEAPSDGLAKIRISTDRATLRGVLSGTRTLTEALRSSAIELCGTTRCLERAFGAFEYFVGALLRIEEAESLRLELESEE